MAKQTKSNIQEETKSTFQEELTKEDLEQIFTEPEPEPESVDTPKTNFHYIVQSPEVLARHLCLMLGCEDQLKETIEWLNSPIQFVEIENLK